MIATQVNPIKKRIDNIVESFILQEIEQWEKSRHVPFHLMKILGEKGIISECINGEDSLSNKLYLASVLGRISLGLSSTVLNTLNIPLYVLNKYANLDQQKQYLEPYLNGDTIGAIAITEKQGGSNFIEDNETRIEIFDDFLLLNGSKHFILNIPGADFIIVLAKSSVDNNLSHTLLIVPTDIDGIKINRINTSGLHTAAFGEIIFNNVRIRKEQVIGRIHRGLVYLEEALTHERIVGTYALMSMTKCFQSLSMTLYPNNFAKVFVILGSNYIPTKA